MNFADSERIAAVLEKKGYELAKKIDEADLLVVNMCSVRQSAVDRVFGVAEKIKKLNAQPANRPIKTILTGCLLPKDRKKFAKKFDEILKFENILEHQPKRKNLQKAYIPISNGCNNACSYCAVPLSRGRLVCRNHKEILNEIKSVISADLDEIWLLGQNVNDYRSPTDSSINFAKLLEMVDNIPGNFKFFFMSPHPAFFTDELIKTLGNCKKYSNFLNLPVQSGDNKILKKMNRPYTIRQYKNLVKKIRDKMPDINLTTDVIIGFPGETKKQFENTAKLFKEVKFNLAYISKYSVRPGTAASKIKDTVPLPEKRRREKVLRKILNIK